MWGFQSPQSPTFGNRCKVTPFSPPYPNFPCCNVHFHHKIGKKQSDFGKSAGKNRRAICAGVGKCRVSDACWMTDLLQCCEEMGLMANITKLKQVRNVPVTNKNDLCSVKT